MTAPYKCNIHHNCCVKAIPEIRITVEIFHTDEKHQQHSIESIYSENEQIIQEAKYKIRIE